MNRRTWENRRERARSVSDEAEASYYGLPVIKAPTWGWLIVWYFFLGGISAAASVIAGLAGLLGGEGGAPIRRVGRYISFAALVPSPLLLILDLQRPERFHHMLRVLKLRSPMSVGTWGLTAFGLLNGLATIGQASADGVLDRLPLVRRLAPLWRLARLTPLRSALGGLGSVFGFFVGGYTGVLLAATAVPLWAKNKLLLGPLFLTSALSTGVAAIALALTMMRGNVTEALGRLERLGRLALLADLALTLAVDRNSAGVIGKPLREGRTGMVHRWGVLGLGLGLPLTIQAITAVLRLGPSRARSFVVSLLTLAGGLALRYTMVFGGRASAEDPEATFALTRRPASVIAPPAPERPAGVFVGALAQERAVGE